MRNAAIWSVAMTGAAMVMALAGPAWPAAAAGATLVVAPNGDDSAPARPPGR
ncbi:hypothetical protein [Streptomyces azureus]|uniref:Putative pectate lyase n=1 Tax=Streptomyces azureus TaxID=146537 RepID=A0A0K8PM28_STRAJ|nr:hypothetical protein [Streptomyces azureus]GAP48823.1 putative pectate lyase [Streptomyces azureus]